MKKHRFGIAAILLTLGTFAILAFRWPALDLPFALISEAEDSVTPLAQGKTIASLVPSATLTVLDDAGHIPHLEGPSEFHARPIVALQSMARPQKQERDQI